MVFCMKHFRLDFKFQSIRGSKGPELQADRRSVTTRSRSAPQKWLPMSPVWEFTYPAVKDHISPPSRSFRVDNFPNFPFGGSHVIVPWIVITWYTHWNEQQVHPWNRPLAPKEINHLPTSNHWFSGANRWFRDDFCNTPLRNREGMSKCSWDFL